MIRAIGVVGGIAVTGLGVRVGYQQALTLEALSLRRVVLHQVPEMLTEQVREQLAPGYGQNLLALDLEGLRLAVEHLPAVRRARIRRVFPDGIEVSIEPREPLAQVQAHGGTYVVDAEGIVLGVPGRDPDLVEIQVDGDRSIDAEPGDALVADAVHGPRLRAALQVVEWLQISPTPLTRSVRRLSVDDDGVVLVATEPPLEIIVGDAEALDDKIAAVQALLRESPLNRPTSLDVRYRGMLVVRDESTDQE